MIPKEIDSLIQTPLIRAQNLTRSIAGKFLLDDVSMTIQPGQGLGLIGESGSGKSSLLRTIAMLEPLDSGCVEYSGKTVHGGSVPSYRRQVAYVSQRPAMITGSVEDNLRLPFSLGISTDAFDRLAAIELLKTLGRAPTLLEQDAGKLSGGEQQLVAISRTLLTQPQVLLLDEPTASLDRVSTQRVESFLLQWKEADPSRAWIWTSHDEDQISRVTDQVLRMKLGKIVQS